MALTLEKIFLQKVGQMPQEEVEVSPHAAKGKGKKSNTSGGTLKSKQQDLDEKWGKKIVCFVFLYEGKNNGSVVKTSSTQASPPQPSVSKTTSSSALEQAALPKVSHHLCL